jgi:hypothetical protein
MNSAAAGDGIIVAARETTALVTPRTADLPLVNLPALEFALRAAIRCKGDPVSLTFSIADTVRTLDSELLGDQRAAETTLTVPPHQLALVASSRFCLADDDTSTNELLVPGMATAHASLQCLDDGRLAVHFASAPLQVRLSCERAPDDARDQEAASEASAPR